MRRQCAVIGVLIIVVFIGFGCGKSKKKVGVGEDGNLDKNILEATKAIGENPGDAQAYNRRGMALFRKGNPDKAIADFGRAIDLNPRNSEFYFNRAAACILKRDYDGGAVDAVKAERLGWKVPDGFWDGVNRGSGWLDAVRNSHVSGLNPAKSLAEYTLTVESDPQNPMSYSKRALLYFERKDYARAVVDLSKVIDLSPRDAQAYYDRGFIYLEGAHDLEKAVVDFSKAIELDPAKRHFYESRGEALLRKGESEKSIGDFNKAIAIDPQCFDAVVGRAEAWFQLKNYDNAWADVRLCQTLGGEVALDFLERLRKESGRNE